MVAAKTSIHALDPARALRVAVRRNDADKSAKIVDWLLDEVPLLWDEQSHPTVKMRVVRGPVGPANDGLAFELDDATHAVTRVRQPDAVAKLSRGDRVVMVDGAPLARPLREVIEPESVAELAVWKRAAMATCRRRLAQRALDAALVEAGRCGSGPAASLVVASLLRASASPAHRDAAGLGALEWAARRGESDVVDQLLRAGVDVDGAAAVKKPPYTALQLAVMGGRAAAARALLEARADPAVRAEGRQLIHLAALAPSPPELLQLLLMGGDDGAEQSVSATTSSGWTPLFLAVGADNLPVTKTLLTLGCTPMDTARGRGLLHHAAACGAAAVAAWLCDEFKAQLPLDGRDSKGRTPLHAAAAHGRLAVLRALLGRGASPIAQQPDGRAPLALAADAECRLLLGAAEKQWRREKGRLLLELAAAGRWEQLRTLHRAGLGLGARDERGFTALHHAAAADRPKTVLYLLQSADGAALSTALTSDADAQAAWSAEQLAPENGAAKPLLRAYVGGGDGRRKVLEQAKALVLRG